MEKFYIADVNAVMTVQAGVIHWEGDGDGRYLKSYMPENNVLWEPEERSRRYEEFEQANEGLIGEGNILLRDNGNGILEEFYSGVQVIPVQSKYRQTVGSNVGDAAYYGASNVEDDTKLYIPFDFLREVTPEMSMKVINGMFEERTRDIQNNVVLPLMKRLEVAQKNSVEMHKTI